MITTVKTPTGFYEIDLTKVAVEMSAREQKKLYKELARWISDEELQSALFGFAEAIIESRKTAADEILAGKWPVTPPIPAEAFDRFVECQMQICLSVCKIPEILKFKEIKHE